MASKLIIYIGENPYSGEKLRRDYILTLYNPYSGEKLRRDYILTLY